MKTRKERTRTAHERELMAQLAHCKQSDARVAAAIVTVLSRSNARILAALGLILEFVAMRATRGPR